MELFEIESKEEKITTCKPFFWFGIELFDSRLKKYGGFNHFIAGKIFRWRLRYLDIYFKRKFKFEIVHNNINYYYGGYHNHVWIGWVLFSYGT